VPERILDSNLGSVSQCYLDEAWWATNWQHELLPILGVGSGCYWKGTPDNTLSHDASNRVGSWNALPPLGLPQSLQHIQSVDPSVVHFAIPALHASFDRSSGTELNRGLLIQRRYAGNLGARSSILHVPDWLSPHLLSRSPILQFLPPHISSPGAPVGTSAVVGEEMLTVLHPWVGETDIYDNAFSSFGPTPMP